MHLQPARFDPRDVEQLINHTRNAVRLLLEIAGRRPWLGHGFGAFWMLDANREEIRRLVGWASQPLMGEVCVEVLCV